MSFHVGQDLGDYQIISIIGAGSMGQVFRVEHRITKRQEAAKVVNNDRLTESQLHRFERETEVQARLDHPNITRVHNAIRLEGSQVLIMEFVEGESLEKKLANGNVSRSAGIDYVCQTLSALEYAHQRSVVHRDINPANLIIDPNGTVKLTDFGLAKSLGDYQLTSAGDIVGSLYYMPPEQVRRQADPDPRSDIYSTGAVLYEVLTGRKLFDCPERLSLMVAQVQQQPRQAVEIDPSIGTELNGVVMKALAKDPNQRYQSAKEFRLALEPFIEKAVATVQHPARRGVVFTLAPICAAALALITLGVATHGGKPMSMSAATPQFESHAPVVGQPSSSDVTQVLAVEPVVPQPASTPAQPQESPKRLVRPSQVEPSAHQERAPTSAVRAARETQEDAPTEAVNRGDAPASGAADATTSAEAESPATEEGSATKEAAPQPENKSSEAEAAPAPKHKHFWTKFNPFKKRPDRGSQR